MRPAELCGCSSRPPSPSTAITLRKVAELKPSRSSKKRARAWEATGSPVAMYISMMAVSTTRSRGLRRSSGIFPALDQGWREGIANAACSGPNLGFFLLSALFFSTYYDKWIQHPSLIVGRFDQLCQGSRQRGKWLQMPRLAGDYVSDWAGRWTRIRCPKRTDGGRWLCTPRVHQQASVVL